MTPLPRTITASYGDPRRPFRSLVPDADLASDDEVLDFVANCITHSDDRDSLRDPDRDGLLKRVLTFIERLDCRVTDSVEKLEAATKEAHQLARDLVIAQGLAAEYQKRHRDAMRKCEALEELRVTAMEETERMRAIAIAAQAEVQRLIRPAQSGEGE